MYQLLATKMAAMPMTVALASELFVLQSLDDAESRRTIVRTLTFFPSMIPSRSFLQLLQTYNHLHKLYNIDTSLGSALIEKMLHCPHLLLQTTTTTSEVPQENRCPQTCALELAFNIAKASPDDAERFVESVNAISDRISVAVSTEALVGILECCAGSPIAVRRASHALMKKHNGTAGFPNSVINRVIRALPRISVEAVEGWGDVFQAAIVRSALQQPGPINDDDVAACVSSFVRLECFNAVAAMLLKYHNSLSLCRSSHWTIFCDAALTCRVKNTSTRRALISRGNELRGTLNLYELGVLARCEEEWKDAVSIHPSSAVATVARVREIICDGEFSPTDLISLFCIACGFPSQKQLADATAGALTHIISTLELCDIVKIMKSMSRNGVYHELLTTKISVMSLPAVASEARLEFAVEYFRLHGTFRIVMVGDVAMKCTETLIAMQRQVSMSEALSVVQSQLRCNFRHQSLAKSMLDLISPAVSTCSSFELYIVASLLRFHEWEHDTAMEKALVEVAIAKASAVLSPHAYASETVK